MSTTINLVDHLLTSGRRFQELGRAHDALRTLGRLSRLGELPGEVAEEAQARLGELQLKRRRFKKARRHLLAALRHQPGSARYQHLMAQACRAEDRGSLKRAASHYRRSLDIDSSNISCLTEYGLLAIQLGRVEEGLKRLREAAAMADHDPEVIGKLVKGLRQAGQTDEARNVVRAAMFRNSRDRRFRELWQGLQMELLLQDQELKRLQAEEMVSGEEHPVLLPFVARDSSKPAREAIPAILRHDGTDQPEQAPRVGPHPDQRHVQ